MAYWVLNGSHITVLGMMQLMSTHVSKKVFLGFSGRDATLDAGTQESTFPTPLEL